MRMTIKPSLLAALSTYDSKKGIKRTLRGDHPAIQALRALSEADQDNSFRVMRCFFENMPNVGTASFQAYQMVASKITAHLSEENAQKLSTIVLHALYTDNLLTEEVFNNIISIDHNSIERFLDKYSGNNIKSSLEQALGNHEKNIERQSNGDHQAIKALKTLSDVDKNNSFKVICCFFQSMPDVGTPSFQAYNTIISRITNLTSEEDAQKMVNTVLLPLYKHDLLTEKVFNAIISTPQVRDMIIQRDTSAQKFLTNALNILHSPYTYDGTLIKTYLEFPHILNLINIDRKRAYMLDDLSNALKLIIKENFFYMIDNDEKQKVIEKILACVRDHQYPLKFAQIIMFLHKKHFLYDISWDIIASLNKEEVHAYDLGLILNNLNKFNEYLETKNSQPSKEAIIAIIAFTAITKDNDFYQNFIETLIRTLQAYDLADDGYENRIVEHKQPREALIAFVTLKSNKLTEPYGKNLLTLITTQEVSITEKQVIDTIMGHSNPDLVTTFLKKIITERSALRDITLTNLSENNLSALYESVDSASSKAKTDDDMEELDPNHTEAETSTASAASTQKTSIFGRLGVFAGKVKQATATTPGVPNVFEDDTFAL